VQVNDENDGVPAPRPLAGLTWRPITADDIDAWLLLEQELEKADELSEHYSAEDLHDELFDGSWKDPVRDSLLGVDAEGVPRAFGCVDVRPGDTRSVRAFCWGGVHPDYRRRGVGAAVLAWQVARGTQKIAEQGKSAPGVLLSYCGDEAVDRKALLTDAGFTPARWYLDMTRPLRGDGAAPLPEVVLDAGLRLVPYDRDDRALDEKVRLAHNEAFAGNWGSEPRSREDWERATTGGRNFRPDWSFVVLDGDEVAGYTLTSAYEQDWAAQGYTSGWTDLLGVRPAWRRRGIAPALLAAAMRAIADSGIDRAELNVDSENGDGALGLYQRLGYEVVHREIAWAKHV
jgi:ribosomal protein S18 acetylase RimI-like enzyme